PFVPTGSQNDAVRCGQVPARGERDAAHALAVIQQALPRLLQKDRHIPRQQLLDEMRHEADAFATHITLLTLAYEVPVPEGDTIDAAPAHLLVRGDAIGRVRRRSHAIAPCAEFEPGNELRFEGAPRPARALRNAIRMIQQAALELA